MGSAGESRQTTKKVTSQRSTCTGPGSNVSKSAGRDDAACPSSKPAWGKVRTRASTKLYGCCRLHP